MKKFVTAAALSTLMISAAVAQTATPPATPAPAATPSTPATSTAAGSPQFVAAQKADQWLGSKFMGTDVIGPNNEAVGDVNDVLFDKSGKIAAVIVGVGGFLGIGEKDVALEMTSFQVVPSSATNSGSGSAPASSATPMDMSDVKLKISMTKDQLKNAPAFERYKAPARTTGTNAPANTGTTGTGGGTTTPSR